MSIRAPGRGPGLIMMLLFWVLLMGFGTWWANAWIEGRFNPNAGLVAVAPGETLRLQRGADGHFVAPGRINDEPVTFLVDTGATIVAIPEALAARLDLPAQGQAWFHTANGRVRGHLTLLDSVSIGGLTAHQVRGSFGPGLEGDMVLLGMSYLRHFDITMRGDTLELKAPERLEEKAAVPSNMESSQ